jgi:hypothetical protein
LDHARQKHLPTKKLININGFAVVGALAMVVEDGFHWAV